MKKGGLFICVFVVALLQDSIHAYIPESNLEQKESKQNYICFLDFFTSENPLIHQKAIDFIGSNWI